MTARTMSRTAARSALAMPLALLLALVWLAGAAAAAPAPTAGETLPPVQNALQRHIAALEEAQAQMPPDERAPVQRALEESLRLQERMQERSQAGDPGEGLQAMLAAMEQMTLRHQEMLHALLGREDMPDEARPALERALAMSRTGHETATQRMALLRQGMTPGQRPEAMRPGQVRPEGMRPEGMGRGMGPGARGGGSRGGMMR